MSSGALYTWPGTVVTFVFVGLTGLIILGLLQRMSREDQALKALFPEWEEWKARVPCSLVPAIW